MSNQVKVTDMENEFLDSIKHYSEETQEICKAVRQQTLKTVKDIQMNFDLEKAEIDTKINALKDQFKENQAATAVLEDILVRHGHALKGMKLNASQRNDTMTTHEYIKSILDENVETLKGVKKGQPESKDLVLKTNYTRSSVTSSTQSQRLDGYSILGYKEPTMYDLFFKVPVGPESNGKITYIDQSTATRNAAGIAEAGTFPESAVVWTEYTLTLQKIGDTIPITEEAMQDTARLAGEVEKFINLNVDLKVDQALITGTGVAPEISGLYTLAPTYTATAAGIDKATIYDLLVKMKEYINVNYGGKGKPNFAVMNGYMINQMKLAKDKNYNYVLPPFVTVVNGTYVVDGMVVIENNNMADDTIVIGDRRFGTLYEIEGYTVSFAPSGTQFVNDLVTMKARRRLALLIRTADQTSFLKCTGVNAAVSTLSGVVVS